jgi:hypothetical protein
MFASRDSASETLLLNSSSSPIMKYNITAKKLLRK